MVVFHDKPGFEALVYTADRYVAARCAEAFAELPIDWTIVDDSRQAAESAATGRYDFLLIDLDSPLGTTLLTLEEDLRGQCVLFGITQGGVDADILEMCYESLIFYPVRIEGLDSELHRAMPLAERVIARRNVHLVQPVPSAQEPEAEPRGDRNSIRIPVPRGWTSLAANLLSLSRQPSRYLLSILWQERIASGISAFGAIWYIHEITRDWSKLAFLIPPTPGPAELIAVATLLWLCAKHRRVATRELEPVRVTERG